MSAYHQMGHDSRNLLREDDLATYSGAVLSPVNDPLDRLVALIQELSSSGMEFIFDPQLYYPDSKRRQLVEWSYFPSDVETADQADRSWWSHVFTPLNTTN
jgi:hypothetical protein